MDSRIASDPSKALLRLAFALLFFAPRAASAQAEAQALPAGDVAARAGDYLERCAVFGWSGAGLVAVQGQVVFERGYGLADRAAGWAFTPDTLVEIASASKPVTACAVMKLVESERIGLDDPICRHLPNVPE